MTKKTIKTIKTTQDEAPLLCLELAGGGYTAQQTAKAMEALGDLLTKGATTINGIHIVIEEEQQPTTQQVGEH